jgi:hypothetical protein
MKSDFGKVDQSAIAEKLCSAARAFDEDDEILGKEIMKEIIISGITYQKCIQILLTNLAEDEIRAVIPALCRVPSSRNVVFAKELFRTGRFELLIQIFSSRRFPALDLGLLDDYCDEFGIEETFNVIEMFVKRGILIESPTRIVDYTYYMKRDISQTTIALVRLFDLGVEIYGKSNEKNLTTDGGGYEILTRETIEQGLWVDRIFLNDWFWKLRQLFEATRKSDTELFLKVLDQLEPFDSLVNKIMTYLFIHDYIKPLDRNLLHKWLCAYLLRPHKHSVEVAVAGLIYFYENGGNALEGESIVSHHVKGRSKTKRGLQKRQIFDVFSNEFDIIEIFHKFEWRSDLAIAEIVSLIRPLLPSRNALAVIVNYFIENHSSVASNKVVAILETTKNEIENYERAIILLRWHAEKDDPKNWLVALEEIALTLPKIDQRIWSIGFEIAIRTKDRRFFNFIRDKIESDPMHIKSYLLTQCVDFELELNDFVAARAEILRFIRQGIYVRPQEVTSLIRSSLPEEIDLSLDTLRQIKAAEVKIDSRSINAICEKYRSMGKIEEIRAVMKEFEDDLGSGIVFAWIQFIQAEYEFGDPMQARQELMSLRKLEFPEFPHLKLAHFFTWDTYPGLYELVKK